MRLKSIKNIEKITNTMKIVASTRLSKAQKAMASSRVFNETDKEFLSNAEPKPIEEEASKSDDKTLLIVVSSDKGLCGSIHSQVSKAARKRTEELNGNVDIVCIGDKVKAQILRTYADKVKLAFNGVGKEEPNFTEVALIADEIAKLGNYENVEILYNKFVSGVSFEPSKFAIYAADAIANSPGLSKYEFENE